MKSNYKRLGDYIERCDAFNVGMEVKELLGISNQKFFQKAKTNTIGINLEKYRIVRTNQFAFNRATTRNGDKISIALRQGTDCIVSPSYRIFKSKDENILNSEYLMMWFRRPEFDRYARFKSHGSAHEFFDMKEMNEVELPIPSIEKQREIVKEYNTVVDRIILNEKLNQKLEETAQALYRHWFIDFEFPNEEGNPYKSSGGEMVYNEKLEIEIPSIWENGTISNLATLFSGYSFKGEDYSFEEGITVVRGENVTEKKLRWDTHKMWNLDLNDRMKKCFLENKDIVIGMYGSKVGKNWSLISNYHLPMLLAQRVACVRVNNNSSLFIYMSMLVLNFESYVSQVQTGTSVPHISGQQILDFPLIIPSNSIIEYFNTYMEPLFTKTAQNRQLNDELNIFRKLLLMKLTQIKVER